MPLFFGLLRQSLYYLIPRFFIGYGAFSFLFHHFGYAYSDAGRACLAIVQTGMLAYALFGFLKSSGIARHQKTFYFCALLPTYTVAFIIFEGLFAFASS